MVATDLAGQLGALEAVCDELARLDFSLRGVPGATCLLSEPGLIGALEHATSELESLLDALESALDAGHVEVGPADLEALNAVLVRCRDVTWALGHDRAESATGILGLARGLGLGDGPVLGANESALRALWAVEVALRALDRLEVRGRDSAGLHLTLAGHGLDLESAEVRELLGGRTDDPLFTSYAVRVSEGNLSLVYKVAAEIGELGDNVAVLRQALAADPLLALVLRSP
ncbi:MAG: hypothetical protein ACP5VR_04290, partial [Acidimicrobiales bacterium]